MTESDSNIPDQPYVSHTYHSPLDDTEKFSEPCILGVDEAGRGPVIGPMVYACAYCPLSYKEDLAKTGYDDSKALTPQARVNLLSKIRADQNVAWAVRVMSARDISSGMLRPKVSAYNLNSQAHDATIELIQQVLRRGVNVQEIYVDTVGPPQTYQAKLSARFPGIQIVVAKKADSLYPIVSAASICAKVTRDMCLEVHDESGGTWGSGYPSDPKTVKWLNSALDPLFGFGAQVRMSWGTVTDLMVKHVEVKWADDYEEHSKKKATGVSQYFNNDVKESSSSKQQQQNNNNDNDNNNNNKLPNENIPVLPISTQWYGKSGGSDELWL